MKALPKGSTAVMARRVEPPDSLEFFPTPPWATRALIHHVMSPQAGNGLTCWEPACGEGHMAEPLKEFFARVEASDIFDYGYGEWAVDFLDDVAHRFFDCSPDWIITNPPFKTALQFAERALSAARWGVALLVRTQWLEGGEKSGRYQFFQEHPPTYVALFAERVPMVKGRWDPVASTATSYCWVVWDKRVSYAPTELMWIPPGCRKALTKPGDVARFAVKRDAPLFDGAAS